jgi:hypothetical protein
MIINNDENQIIYQENDFKIIQRKKDGFIFATYLAKLCNKKVSDFLRLDQTKKFIDILLKELKDSKNYPLNYVYETIQGGNSKDQGTYMHPYLLTFFANWLSPYFAVRVSKWIEEWKNFKDDENKKLYYNELQSLKIENKHLIEKEIQELLSLKLNGKKEVETKFGFIDILTHDSIIEIKHISNWKHALGQILCYSQEYKDKQKIIYLFDCENMKIKIFYK